jgi:hypothetical protein
VILKDCKKCGGVGVPFYKSGRCQECHKACCAAWSAANPERKKANSAAWRAAHPEYLKEGRLVRNYGLTLEQHAQMLMEQNGKCAICSGELKPGRGTQVDHCHTTGKVRSLLCNHCNRGLGGFTDSPRKLREAANYLESFAPQL